MNILRQPTIEMELSMMEMEISSTMNIEEYDAIASNLREDWNYKPVQNIQSYAECIKEQSQYWAYDFKSTKKILGLNSKTPAFLWESTCGGESHMVECPDYEHDCERQGCGKSWTDSSFTEQGVNVLTTQGWTCVDYRNSSERSTMPF